MGRRRLPSSRSSRPGSRPSGRRRLSTESGPVGSTGAPNLPPADEGRQRPSIDERAARRTELESGGRDRYDSLLRHLQAGRELQVQPRSKRAFGLDIHPSARTVLIIALVVAVVWIGAILVTDVLRADRVDTWTGPDRTVTSGQRLAGCADLSFPEDVYFPDWIRFDGRLYRWTDEMTPIGTASFATTYQASGYTLGDLELFRIINTPDGRDGKRIMVRQGDSYAGAIYVLSACGA